MPRRSARTLTEFELEIMRIVWDHKETTVLDLQRDLKRAGRPVAQPTVRTMLGILEEKGYLARQTGRRWHTYRPTVSAEQARKGILRDIIERAFDGSAMSLVAALVKGEMVSKKDLQQVRRLIEQREKEEKK